MELRRERGVATYITFPLIDVNGDAVSGVTGLDSEIDTWTNVLAPDGFTDCTNEASEIGGAGVYGLELTLNEMDNLYIYIQVKSNEAKTQHILIQTFIPTLAVE